MRVLGLVWEIVCGIFSGLRDFFGTVLGGLFGELSWTAPAWLAALLATAGRIAGTIRERSSPRILALGAVAVVAIAVGVGGWQYWQRQQALAPYAAGSPEAGAPHDVRFDFSAPKLTCYGCDTEAARAAQPLTLRFPVSVAPLEWAGKTLPADKGLVTLTPDHPGSWRWDDDKTLSFTPSKDWPANRSYKVRFAREGFALPGLSLADSSFDFTTEPFRVWIEQGSFVQSPVDPTQKTVQFVVRASHPVDPGSFTERIKLRYWDALSGGRAQEREAPAYTLSWDAAHLVATLTTATMTLADNAQWLDLFIDDGVRPTVEGNTTADEQNSRVEIPGRGDLKVTQVSATIARDADDNPVQTLTLELSQSAAEDDVRGKVQAWLLPLKHPDAAIQKAFDDAKKGNAAKPYRWTAATAQPLLKNATAVTLDYNVLESEHSPLHSFRHKAAPGQYMYVRVPQGLKAFGGYVLAADDDRVLRVPEYPAELRLTHSGALLAYSGARKLTVFTRDLPGVRVQIGRLLPQQIQHVVTQSRGRLDEFDWNNWSLNEGNLAEFFSKDLPLPALEHGVAHYEPLDLAPYLAQGESSRRGIFFLRLSGYDPKDGKAFNVDAKNRQAKNEYAQDQNQGEEEGYDEYGEGYDYDYGYGSRTRDTRLVVITDLGLISKSNIGGSRDVFVQSIASGEPLADVAIEVIAKNGQSVLTRTTDREGHVQLPALDGFSDEKTPVLLLARKGGDESFLPLDGRASLDLSRFDVGGLAQASDPGSLSAYMFSDRGLYRPGETAHIGVIVKAGDFDHALPSTPVDYEVTDPRGTIVYKTTRTLPAAGFEELEYASSANAASGIYTLNAWLPGAQGARDRRQLGALSFKVREFEPDRLKINMSMNASRAQGWLKPDAISGAHVELNNLFGTPAQERRVTGEIRLTPWLPSFEGWGGWQFNDPQAATEGITVSLNDSQTDTDGKADLDIDLSPYAATSYFLHLTTQGFEPGGGRGVTAEAGQVISSLPYLVGWKSDASLGWIAKESKAAVKLAAIDPQAQRTTADGLKLRYYSRNWVSVLTRSDRGYYHYESKQKDDLLRETKLAIPAAGTDISLDTSTPGNFIAMVVNASGQVLAKIPYQVSGWGDVTRSLDRNAELKLSLAKKDYQPGEELEINLVAPYAGAGLITIERDKVLAYQWFKADSTASVQKIKLPDGLEGSAYVHVMFTRDPASEEVFMSPLSYGVVPFSVAIDNRRAPLTLEAPAKVKPGDTLHLKLTAAKPGKALVYAVDEGILQVARYTTPDPLAFYFQKRSLGVMTQQILDLVLPEFRGLPVAAAPGGDADNALGARLNPFKRKTDEPIAWWSGLVDVGPEATPLQWTVPDRFNGALRLVAVSVTSSAIGVVEQKTLVRGDFVLLPNAPLAVTPGDVFEVSTGISNNIETAPKDAPIVVTIAPTANLEVVGAATQTVPISALREGIARWQVRAKDGLGNAELAFTAGYGGKSAKIRSTLSIRPPMPYSPNLSVVQVDAGKTVDIPITRAAGFFPEFRSVEASASALPLVMAHGLTAYLGNYKNYCTEQLTSMAMPALVLSARPEFGKVRTSGHGSIAGLINELALRQTPEGDFAYWTRGGSGYEPVSIYALHFLLEAREHGQYVPPGMLEAGNRFLTKVARREINPSWDYYYSYQQRERRYGYSDRNVAYAIYLLTRQGQLMAAEADAAVQRLDSGDRGWRNDSTALWLAAAYDRMQQKDRAEALVKGVLNYSAANLRSWSWRYGWWYFANSMSTDAEILYIIAKHFPAQLAKYGPGLAKSLVDDINGNGYQSYASGTTLLALDAYATLAEQEQGKYALAEIDAGGHIRPLELPKEKTAKLSLSADATKLRVVNNGDLPTYGMVAEMGFPRATPKKAEAHGIEILREFLGADGKPVTKAELGKELTVEVRLRATDRDAVQAIAITDLLPGGFEIQQTSDAIPEPVPTDASTEEGSYEGGDYDNGEESGDETEKKGECNCDWVEQAEGQLDFAEPREDRAVLYGNATREVQIFRYKVKAVTEGRYIVPPAYGEAMYERSVFGYSAGSTIEVVKPAP